MEGCCFCFCCEKVSKKVFHIVGHGEMSTLRTLEQAHGLKL